MAPSVIPVLSLSLFFFFLSFFFPQKAGGTPAPTADAIISTTMTMTPGPRLGHGLCGIGILRFR